MIFSQDAGRVAVDKEEENSKEECRVRGFIIRTPSQKQFK
jgi:hypothetical protein